MDLFLQALPLDIAAPFPAEPSGSSVFLVVCIALAVLAAIFCLVLLARRRQKSGKPDAIHSAVPEAKETPSDK